MGISTFTYQRLSFAFQHHSARNNARIIDFSSSQQSNDQVLHYQSCTEPRTENQLPLNLIRDNRVSCAAHQTISPSAQRKTVVATGQEKGFSFLAVSEKKCLASDLCLLESLTSRSMNCSNPLKETEREITASTKYAFIRRERTSHPSNPTEQHHIDTIVWVDIRFATLSIVNLALLPSNRQREQRREYSTAGSKT